MTDLLEQNSDLLARLKISYGADKETFERDIMRAVSRYADFVHLLPATPDNYFSTPGGLFRLGLEVAFFSLQGTDGHIFSGRSTITERRHLEPRWRLATFLAGLCSGCHRALNHLLVVDACGDPWSAYMNPLLGWLTAKRASRYYVRWLPQVVDIRALGVFALPHIVPADVMRALAEDNTVVVPQFMASLGGAAMYRDHNVLDGLVRRSLALVIDRNLAASADRYGKPQFGSHLERYLVDALRRLASDDPAWIPNREKSRVWFGDEGLFLLWPAAAEDVRRVLEADQLQGIPKAAETMLEVLLAAGAVTPCDGSRRCWTIRPPQSKLTHEAVRLSSPAILFASDGESPVPLSTSIVVRATEPAPAAPSRDTTEQPRFDVPPGTQLSLIPEDRPPATPPDGTDDDQAPAHGPSDPSCEPVPLSLAAPLRLQPGVRDALAAIVNTLNIGSGPAQCRTVQEGLFVPLEQFERRGIPCAVALRALGEVGLLIGAGKVGSSTHSCDFDGKPTAGLILDPRSIKGFDPRAFTAT